MSDNGWTELDISNHESIGPLTTPHWVYSPASGEVGIAIRHAGSSSVIRLDAGGRTVVPDDGFTWRKAVASGHGPLPGKKVWKNPLPVVVMLVRTLNGVLLVRRAASDTYGRIALPGGFQEEGETWQEAGCREVLEETGIVLNPSRVAVFDVETVEGGRRNLIYGRYADVVAASDFTPQESEILEVLTTKEAMDLAFPSHTAMLSRLLSEA